MTDDLVKRLRDVGRGYDFHENALVYSAADRIEALTAENERVREALSKIAAECWVTVGTDAQMYSRWRKLAVERVDIARAALASLPKETTNG
jgi:hypothetical protein